MMTSFSRVCRLRLPLAVMAVAIVVAMCLPAHAVKVTNVSTGEVLFEDDYENPLAGSGDSIPLTGTWLIQRGPSMKTADASPPGPVEGLQYGTNPGGESKIMGAFDTIQTNTGDLIRAEWMSYLADAPATERFISHAFWQHNDGGETVTSILDINFDSVNSGKISSFFDSQWNDLGLDVVFDQWVPASLDYVVGATDYSLTYNGTTVIGGTRNPGPVGQFQVGHGAGTTMHIDAVPEPSTCALALMGLLTLAGCCGRRRAK